MPRTARLGFSPVLLAIAIAIAITGLVGCSAYEPFRTTPHLRQQISERLPADLALEVEIPFELSAELKEVVETRLNPTVKEEHRVEDIISHIFGSLELNYSLTPTRNAVETYRSRQGNCLSFVNLFVGMARQQRLNPFYVEVRDYQRWNFRDGVVVSRGHIVAGLNIDGELRTYDFLPYRPKAYRDFRPIDDLTAMAHFYNNLGAEALMSDDIETAEHNLEIATKLAPDFEKALNNMGIVHLRQGRLTEGVAVYQRGLELHPESVPLMTNLARSYQRLGDTAKASALLDQLEDVNQTNPYFFVYRGEMALNSGDLAAALKYMREALRTDSEVPEVHIGLVKVYLAMGDLGKARHHVERALRLDATDEESREYAAMLGARIGAGS